MATEQQLEHLGMLYGSAKLAGHLWPDYAACEGVLETRWGTSELYRQACNVFGEKQHEQPIFQTVMLPTHEFVDGVLATTTAAFIWFPTAIEAFRSRMATLRRLAGVTDERGALVYPGYAAALAATSGEQFVIEVSKNWSTDPDRASVVLAIHRAHLQVFAAQPQEREAV